MQEYFNQIEAMQKAAELEAEITGDVDTETVTEDTQLLPEVKNISEDQL